MEMHWADEDLADTDWALGKPLFEIVLTPSVCACVCVCVGRGWAPKVGTTCFSYINPRPLQNTYTDADQVSSLFLRMV